jgi:hypothetical protein
LRTLGQRKLLSLAFFPFSQWLQNQQNLALGPYLFETSWSQVGYLAHFLPPYSLQNWPLNSRGSPWSTWSENQQFYSPSPAHLSTCEPTLSSLQSILLLGHHFWQACLRYNSLDLRTAKCLCSLRFNYHRGLGRLSWGSSCFLQDFVWAGKSTWNLCKAHTSPTKILVPDDRPMPW